MVGGVRGAINVLPVLALVISACMGEGDTEGSGDEEFTLPPRSHPSTSPGKAVGAGERTITGVLAFDDIEGGCAFVQAADGSRYEVIYPDGWTLDRSSGELGADDGRVARVGDAITIRGSTAAGRSSICQIGPIIVASEVSLAGR
jgi:hypothetical protein